MSHFMTPIRNSRILVVDDTESIHEDFRKILIEPFGEKAAALNELEKRLFEEDAPVKERGHAVAYEIHDAFQGEEAVEMVRDAKALGNPYALVFMDVRMPPGISGIEAIEAIWRIDPYVEIVICTAYSDISWEGIIGKVGSTDRLLFLKKPFYSVEVKQMALSLVIKWNLNMTVRELVANLEEEVQIRTDQLQKVLEELQKYNLELHQKNQALAEMIERDGLTGLYNHTALHRRLEELFEENRRLRIPFSVIMLDIDNFKTFNDTYGHQVGDEVLIKVAEVIKNDFQPLTQFELENEREKCVLRKYDVAARYGGDEFAVLLPYCGEEEAKVVSERLLEKIRGIHLENACNLRVSASMGVAVLSRECNGKSGKDLLVLADKALYSIKLKGKNGYHLMNFSPQEVEQVNDMEA